MRVFMLGNGFDLLYQLPTKYVNFLQVTKYIIDNNTKPNMPNSVSTILSNVSKVYPKSNINACITAYGAAYDAFLDGVALQKYAESAKQNLWFNYLASSFDKDVGWIDFETEMGKVLKAVKHILKENQYYYKCRLWCKQASSDRINSHILQLFPIFIDLVNKEERYDTSTGRLGEILYPVQEMYILEEPKGSGVYTINEEKVASDLYKASRGLATLLATYLSWFVEKPVRFLSAMGKLPLYDALSPQKGGTHRISFNYTHTAELLKFFDKTGNEIIDEDQYYYIHGQLSSDNLQIVLGINSDGDDEPISADTRFIEFKKYYQRVYYKTDISYLNFLRETDKKIETKRGSSCSNNIGEYDLIVIGHSLDITDKEIITDLFSRSNCVSILYHDQSAIKGYMSNLITIFGKEGFDELRFSRHLEFLPLSSLNDRNSFNRA